jgi:hypothetical protein
MSGDQQNAEQFNLVSLDKSKQAANSYSSMSKRARGESESTLSVNEEEAKEKMSGTAELAKAPPKPPEKKAPQKAPPLPKDSGDSMEQTLEDVMERLEEFNQSVQQLLANASVAAKNISIMLITPLLPFLNGILSLLNIPLQFINLLTRKVNERMGKPTPAPVTNPETGEVSTPQQAVEAAPEPVAEAKQAKFTDMIELNIVFTDNMKKPLYKKQQSMAQKLGAMEEDLIFSNALLAVSECAEFTADLPSPSTGLYAGQKIYDIMSNVTKNDVAIFLGFVKAFPGKYIGKEWKISETFATWLINNAPVAE